MNITLIDRCLALSGDDFTFNDEPFFGLMPGDKITQIGDGRENGCIRTDKFIKPVQYVGSIDVQFQEVERMYAFEFFEKGTDGKPLYLIYGSTGAEIFTECLCYVKDKTGYLRFYEPVFTRF